MDRHLSFLLPLLFAGGALAAYTFVGNVQNRFNFWLHPMDYYEASPGSYQLVEALFGAARRALLPPRQPDRRRTRVDQPGLHRPANVSPLSSIGWTSTIGHPGGTASSAATSAGSRLEPAGSGTHRSWIR